MLYNFVYNFLFLAKVKPKGRSKKNLAKDITKSPSEEIEINKKNDKEQNEAIQEDNAKTKNVKNAKKGNAKKIASRGKLNAVVEKANDVEEEVAEEAAIPEMDVKENGEAYAESKQKKKNAGKANAAMNGKIEAKGKQKKGQTAVESIDKKEATKDETETENETTEMNVTSEIDGNNIKDVSLSKDDSILQNEEEENEVNESKDDSMKDEVTVKMDTSTNELERSGTFLCF